MVRDQLVIHCDFQLPARHRLLDELTARREDLRRQLAFGVSDEPIHVYLFEDESGYEDFRRTVKGRFPNRRALFVESDTRLEVYAQWAGMVGEDLRHEVTHAYLHSVLPNIPLWLDEGLAEYFEVPRGRQGFHREHLELLLAAPDRLGDSTLAWRPSLARLESLSTAREMTPEEYAESWAWVHFLLHSAPETRRLLQEYLYSLHLNGSTVPLSTRLVWLLRNPEDHLAEHLAELGIEAGVGSPRDSAAVRPSGAPGGSGRCGAEGRFTFPARDVSGPESLLAVYWPQGLGGGLIPPAVVGADAAHQTI